MSCEHGTSRRLPLGIAGAVVINIVLLALIPLLFQRRSLPKRLPRIDPIPVWQPAAACAEDRRKMEPEKPESMEPLFQPPAPVLPPLDLAPELPRPDVDAPQLDMTFSPELKAVVPSITMPRPAAPAPEPVGPFSPGDLDRQPMALQTVEPVYPFAARRRGIEGQVEVRFVVDAAGAVRDIFIVNAEPPGIFEDAVRRTLSRWRFKPGMRRGEAVATLVQTAIVFKLDR
ncbi:MAG: TonB family protein [Deltaproteobacteria bacterium]|nr:TonB family protein [Candidatus Anaeroferrophillacea bacterium]